MEDTQLYQDLPDAWGMHYSAGRPQEIQSAPAAMLLEAGADADTINGVCGGDDAAGSFLSHLRHAVTAPFSAAAHIVDKAVTAPVNLATGLISTPFNVMNRAARALPGDGSPGPAAAPAAMPAPMDAPPEGDPNMPTADAAGHWFHPHHHHHHAWRGFPPAVAGWGLPGFLRRKPPGAAGKLLVSAVPGGATALQAREIANKGLKDGTLNPEHVKKAAALTKAARAGSPGALGKIAGIKRAAGAGDPHAEVALDRLKLVDCIQTGKKCHPGGTGTLRHAYNDGIATLNFRPAKM